MRLQCDFAGHLSCARSYNAIATQVPCVSKAKESIRVLPGELFAMQAQRIANSNAMQILGHWVYVDTVASTE
jgi:hypothetical protein